MLVIVFYDVADWMEVFSTLHFDQSFLLTHQILLDIPILRYGHLPLLCIDTKSLPASDRIVFFPMRSTVKTQVCIFIYR